MIKKILLKISENFKTLSEESVEDIQSASKLMVSSIKNKGKIIFCGNGGSAADSQHLAAELVGRYKINRKPIAAIALTTDTSVITAIANDFTNDHIFERQLEALGRENDLLYAISTSGKSKNVLNAMKLAQNRNIKVIGLTGNVKSKMGKFSDVLIKTPSSSPDRIQEMHIAIGQILCELIEMNLYGKENT